MSTKTGHDEIPTSGLGRPRAWVAGTIVAILLFIQAGLAFASLYYDSVTFDELTHFTSGESYWQTGDFRLDPENPPLINYWSTLPLRWIEHAPINIQSKHWHEGEQWHMGREWFNHDNDGERLLWYGRAMMILLLLCFSLTVFAVAKRILGTSSALLSLACIVFWPTILGHGRLVTSDVPLALFSLLALWRTQRLLDKPTVVRWCWAAGACACLFLTKYSAILTLPAFASLGAISTYLAIRRGKSTRNSASAAPHARSVPPALRPTCLLLTLACSTWIAIWSAYGWRFSMFADDLTLDQMAAVIDENPQTTDARVSTRRYWLNMLTYTAAERDKVLVPFAVQTLEHYRILPSAYLYGFMYTYHSAQGRRNYLMGEFSDTGWWYYFPVAFLVKTPLPIIALGILGIASFSRKPKILRQNAALLGTIGVFAFVYFVVSLTTKINIGERHLVPTYFLVALAVGLCTRWMQSKIGRVIVCSLSAWMVLNTFRSFPDFLSFFNSAAGGSANGHQWLADSNTDWGQGLARIARYAEKHPDEKILLAYFGSADPVTYLQCTSLPSFHHFGPVAGIEPGTYIVSATQLHGVYIPEARSTHWEQPLHQNAISEMTRLANAPLAAEAPPLAVKEQQEMIRELEDIRRFYVLYCLLKRTPDERLGAGYFVYRLSADDLQDMFGGK